MSAEPVAVAEVYRAHYGGRTRNVGFNSVRLLVSGDSVAPGDKLYDRATLDAAVAAAVALERERCETLARYALDAATEGNWAYAAVLLQRIKGEPSGSDAAAIRDLKPE